MISPWVESHIEIGDHPKTYVLITDLNVRKAEAVGLLHLLWHFTLKFAWRDGDLSRFDAVAIAHGAGWEGDANVFIDSLQKSGFLDGMKVHDWLDFAGRLVKDRLRYFKVNKVRTHSVRNKAVKRTVSVANHTIPNHTIPNLTLPDQTNTTKPNLTNFEEEEKETTRSDFVEIANNLDKPKIQENGNKAVNGLMKAIGDKSFRKSKAVEQPTLFWKETVEHISKSWEKKKGIGLYWKPQYFKHLKSMIGIYQPWGIMALWDVFLMHNDAWTNQAGHSFEAFVSKLPSLVDDLSWKTKSKDFETKLLGVIVQ